MWHSMSKFEGTESPRTKLKSVTMIFKGGSLSNIPGEKIKFELSSSVLWRVELSYRELNSTTIIACGYFPMLTNRTRLMSPAGYTVLECFNRHGCDSYVYLFTMRRPPSLSNSRRFACIIVRHRLFTVPHRRSKGEGLSSWRTELGRTQAV